MSRLAYSRILLRALALSSPLLFAGCGSTDPALKPDSGGEVPQADAAVTPTPDTAVAGDVPVASGDVPAASGDGAVVSPDGSAGEVAAAGDGPAGPDGPATPADGPASTA